MNEKELSSLDTRTRVLKRFGATSAEVDELLAYNRNVFDHSMLESGLTLPLDDEPFLSSWQTYVEESEQIGVFAALRKRLIQLNFPIHEGISATEEYRAAIKKGILSEERQQRSGLEMRRPDALKLLLHPTSAGRIPVIITEERDDFIALLRAFTFKNEPHPVPASQGAAMIAGYNNWNRLWKIKDRLRQEQGVLFTEAAWSAAFQQILPQKHRYQDKLILLSCSYYSGVTPDQIGLDEETWRDISLRIRLEHECAHYFTKRALASMQNKMLDELISDYAGIVSATGTFRADWFLRFVGLEAYPAYREGGRLQNYAGNPPLSPGAFRILQMLVYHAAHNIERGQEEFARRTGHVLSPLEGVLALTRFTLEELAADDAVFSWWNRA
ncbi:hypothetical protein U14_02727 [Candidatus Moduliflexus flocculans]|uniref:Uncharacterized protein n=1 Tax=Candidatus Moduliflexus flocculans TaxID=1499966 RepID=A0A081BM67_9BACT|nr:hypothetical protein U14_02727 [Candidatus Moduliflexus flocculans]